MVKKYPERRKPIPISKKELLALIDSVETPDTETYEIQTVKDNITGEELDLSGVFIK